MKNKSRSSIDEAKRYWGAFGFENIQETSFGYLSGAIPEGVVALCSSSQAREDEQRQALQRIGIPPSIYYRTINGLSVYLYALCPASDVDAVKSSLQDHTNVKVEGDVINLPIGEAIEKFSSIENASDLSEFELPIEEGFGDLPQQVAGTEFDQFSLRDIEMEEETCSPLLSSVGLSGQATTVYAPPNTGKTLLVLYLILQAVRSGVLNPSLTYVINADDSLEGVSIKRGLLASQGVHMLVPGKQGFDTGKLISTMKLMIEQRQCEGVLLVVDTLKKFVDLMDKRSAADFGQLVRQFVLAGGTFFALAHTRKNEGADGKFVYGGTTDIVEDFDAICLLVPLAESGPDGEKLVQFQFTKRRGANVDETYAYDDDPELAYRNRLETVRQVRDDELREQISYDQYRQDESTITVIRRALGEGHNQKMDLVKTVANRTGCSRQTVLSVLDRYSGKDPSKHEWNYEVKARGAKIYTAYPQREDVEE